MLTNDYNGSDDITKEITPQEFLGTYIAMALRGGWCMWIPRWAWRMYNRDAKVIERCLEDFGITNEELSNNPKFKKILERGY